VITGEWLATVSIPRAHSAVDVKYRVRGVRAGRRGVRRSGMRKVNNAPRDAAKCAERGDRRYNDWVIASLPLEAPGSIGQLDDWKIAPTLWGLRIYRQGRWRSVVRHA
jgi:hypothetical protein